MSWEKGFTLLELMVTVGVASILFALATPSFIELTVRNRLTTYTNDLVSSVNFARSEAIRRGVPISVCPSIAGIRCSGGWSDGWIVFVNTDGDSPAVVDAGEPVLCVHEALTSGYTMSANPVFVNTLTYGGDGAASDSGVFALCHGATPTGGRAVVITRLRPRVARDTDGDGIPNKDTGNIADCVNP